MINGGAGKREKKEITKNHRIKECERKLGMREKVSGKFFYIILQSYHRYNLSRELLAFAWR